MKLFETSWRDGFKYFERYYDTELEKSVKHRLHIKNEFYEPCSVGTYEYFLDPSIRLQKVEGPASEGREEFGFLNPIYRNIRDNYWKNAQYNASPRILFLDIETRVGQNSSGFPIPEKALEPISMFQLYDSVNDYMIIIGTRDWVHQKEYLEHGQAAKYIAGSDHFKNNDEKVNFPVKYINAKNESKLIRLFLDLYKKLDPLIVYAWNGSGFDFPYIYNRMKNLGMDTSELSNYGDVQFKMKDFAGRKVFDVQPAGHYWIDLKDVYKKFILKPVTSYSLDNIASVELKKNKVKHTEYDAFDDFYSGKYRLPDNPTPEQEQSKIYQAALNSSPEVKELAHSEFVYYGLIDTYLLKELDDKIRLTDIILNISQKTGVLVSDSLGTVKPWSQYLANTIIQDKKVMPRRREFDHPNVVGGHVKDPVKGKHKWVLSADVNSMYPLLSMVGFNMSPETFIQKGELPDDLRDIVLQYYNDQDETKLFEMSDDIKDRTKDLLNEHNLALSINGAVFDKSYLGVIPALVKNLYDDRKKDKAKMFEYENQKLKIQEVIKAKLKNVSTA